MRFYDYPSYLNQILYQRTRQTNLDDIQFENLQLHTLGIAAKNSSKLPGLSEFTFDIRNRLKNKIVSLLFAQSRYNFLR